MGQRGKGGRNYSHRPRIDDIIRRARRKRAVGKVQEHLSPPLTKAQLTALRNSYDIPTEHHQTVCRYNDGRWFGSEANWNE